MAARRSKHGLKQNSECGEEANQAMAKKWEDVRAEARAKYGFDDARSAKLQRQLLAEMRAYRMVEIRETLGLEQIDLADQLGVTVASIERIERGDLDRTEIGTIRTYVAALGGEVEIVARFGDERLTIG
jgi:ribosome-binding protein aMBF1 (putative translation factor)